MNKTINLIFSEENEDLQFLLILKNSTYILNQLENKSIDYDTKNKIKSIIKDYIEKNNLYNRLNLEKKKYIKDVIIPISRLRNESIKKLNDLNDSFNTPKYQRNIKSFRQDIISLLKNNTFKFLVKPSISQKKLCDLDFLSILINAIIKTDNIQNKEEHYHEFEEDFKKYFNVESNDDEIDLIFVNIGKELFKIFLEKCEFKETKYSNIKINITPKKYNFSSSRKSYNLSLKLSNLGDGKASKFEFKHTKDSNFKIESTLIQKPTITKGETTIATLNCTVNNEKDFINELITNISWKEIDGSTKSVIESFSFNQQNVEIDWEKIEIEKPYSTKKVEERELLFGRDELLDELIKNTKSRNFESYKIWGQKRIGKSSIIKTLNKEINQYENIISIIIDASLSPEPKETINEICIEIYDEFINEFNEKFHSFSDLIKQVEGIEEPNFESGTFNELIRFFKKITRLKRDLKIQICIDEFDKINREFFMPGMMGDVFSEGLGKKLAGLRNISIIIIGSENMSLLNRQEINYNEFGEKKIDSFDKQQQYSDFKSLITKPVSDILKYHDDAIELIYDLSNGNPYFAKLICKEIIKICKSYDENEIDINIVQQASLKIINSESKTHFTQFWVDGIIDDSEAKRDVTEDIRKRLLISYNKSFLNNNKNPTKTQIINNVVYPNNYTIEEFQFENSFTDFLKRKIFFLDNNQVTIKPLIFQNWLCHEGNQYLIDQGLANLSGKLKEDEVTEKIKLVNEEYSRIVDKIASDTFNVSKSKLKSFFEQFGDAKNQRLIYNLIDNLIYIPQIIITDFFRKNSTEIFKYKDRYLKNNQKNYRNVCLISINKDRENEELFNSFKTLSRINKLKSLQEFNNIKVQAEEETIIIFEPTLLYLDKETKSRVGAIKEKVSNYNKPIRLISISTTNKTKNAINRIFKDIEDFKFVYYKSYDAKDINPFVDQNEIMNDKDQSEELYFKLRSLDTSIEKEESSAIIYENMCPKGSLSILWNKEIINNPLFPNNTKKELIVNKISTLNINKTKLSKLEKDLNKILQHFEKALMYEENDPETSLNYGRKTVEAILKHIYTNEEFDKESKPASILSFEEIFKNNQMKKVIPRTIQNAISTVQGYGNLGSHDQEEQEYDMMNDKLYARTCNSAIKNILKWELEIYLANSKINTEIKKSLLKNIN